MESIKNKQPQSKQCDPKCCKAFAGKCPVTDSLCLNPICAFGCIEDMKEQTQPKN